MRLTFVQKSQQNDLVRRGVWNQPSFFSDPLPNGYRQDDAWTGYFENEALGWQVGLHTALTQSGAWDVEQTPGREEFIAAVQWFAQMLQLADQVLSRIIAEGMTHGLSFADVGRAFQISRQAAHKRFADLVEAELATATK